jgi:uncharacterized protein (TIGR01615 family)
MSKHTREEIVYEMLKIKKLIKKGYEHEALVLYMRSLGYFAEQVQLSSKLKKFTYFLPNKFSYIMIPNNEIYIIDFNFKESFAIARPSDRYKELYEKIPSVFIGSIQDLKKCVFMLCDRMKTSFINTGIDLPPWRCYKSMITKWRFVD